ncbi:hypothetical protein DIPPA_30326 [Diplonema papillatum]|nr:hypothetical protein DIPPA_30326 [Diplonema papillatum]
MHPDTKTDLRQSSESLDGSPLTQRSQSSNEGPSTATPLARTPSLVRAQACGISFEDPAAEKERVHPLLRDALSNSQTIKELPSDAGGAADAPGRRGTIPPPLRAPHSYSGPLHHPGDDARYPVSHLHDHHHHHHHHADFPARYGSQPAAHGFPARYASQPAGLHAPLDFPARFASQPVVGGAPRSPRGGRRTSRPAPVPASKLYEDFPPRRAPYQSSVHSKPSASRYERDRHATSDLAYRQPYLEDIKMQRDLHAVREQGYAQSLLRDARRRTMIAEAAGRSPLGIQESVRHSIDSKNRELDLLYQSRVHLEQSLALSRWPQS